MLHNAGVGQGLAHADLHPYIPELFTLQFLKEPQHE